VSTDPVILHCPNCGAPLELVGGACRWCREHVTLPVAPSLRDADDDEDDRDDGDDEESDVVRAEEGHDRIKLGDSESTLLPPSAWILSTLSWVTYDLLIQAFFAAHPDLLELVRPLAVAVQAAGERIQGTGLPVEELMGEGFDKAYTPEEMWTFELSADVLVWLTALDGVDSHMRVSVQRELNRSFWTDPFKKPLKKAGDGPVALRQLRGTVPHRSG
jgi:hypothetical protein